MDNNFTELEKIRREKLEALKNNGIKPFNFLNSYDNVKTGKELEQQYNSFAKEELESKNESSEVVGRIITFRGPFIVLKDFESTSQVYIDKDNVEIIKIVDFLDIGDIINVKGIVMKTKTGQITLKAKELKLLTKSLKPLPNKWHGLKDVEQRYRQRYIDLLDDDIKKIFWTRTNIIKAIRSFFDNLNYMEVETPILQPILGGAAAKPFITHHNALDMEFYLRIATELPLKRLLVGGIDRVYEIGRIFRNEGIDTTHNPEFTSIEFYEAYANLETMIKRTEDVILDVANKLNLKSVEYEGQTIEFKKPFARIDMIKAVSDVAKVDFEKISLEEAKDVAKKMGIEIQSYFTIGHIINEIFSEKIEQTLIQPTFVVRYPIEISPLAAKNQKDPRFVDRAELFICGREYANMFTELHDPIDQLARFESQLAEKEAGNEEANEIDQDFVNALEYGMPPAGGCGIGIDRLVMLLTQKSSIREVLLFPHLKNKDKPNKGEENE